MNPDHAVGVGVLHVLAPWPVTSMDRRDHPWVSCRGYRAYAGVDLEKPYTSGRQHGAILSRCVMCSGTEEARADAQAADRLAPYYYSCG